ncbi:hypothetical protein GCM10022393_10380 [Aquimarina addita]|uniref:T9SS type A sorting domain-containing protein n=1 Tax=Aquimarina addita TaxID=870485 RepID=A0ABP7XD14_9FLAO
MKHTTHTILVLFFTCIFSISYGNTDKYRLIINTDPATTITIGWNQITGTNPILYYGTTDFGTDYIQYENSKTVDRSVSYRGMENQFARLTDLLPNTAYYFVIHDSEGESERFWFKTAPNDQSRLSFIAGGDSRNNRTPRQQANLLVSKLKPHAVLFGGDMTDDDSDSEWQNWFDDWQLTTATDGRMFPIVATRGNHEGATVIYNLFDTPTDDSYYAVTFGNNLFRTYTLNSEISVSGNQLTWLENDLTANASVRWKAAQYHKPMRPHTASKSEGNSQYNAWAELFYEEGVRLVVDCDSHMVKTTWPVQPSSASGNDEGFIRDDINGTVYTGEGCWGAPLRSNDDDKEWTRNSGSFNQFKLIFVETSKIELRTIAVDNAADVASVTNEDPFTLPANLDVWNPSEGDVITILPGTEIVAPEINFESGTPTEYQEAGEITLTIDVISEGNGIATIDFYVNDVLRETDTDSPYSLTDSYASGSYKIEAIATTTDNQIDATTLYISVGDYSFSESIAIAEGNDDIEETETGVVYFDSSDLEMTYDSYDYISDIENGFQKIGLRFQNVNIPQGATIDNAYIQFRSDEDNTDAAALLITVEDSNNSAPFENSSSANISGRDKMETTVAWNPDSWTDSGLTGIEQQTSDIKELLQLIIDKNDWTPGNSMAFMIEGTGVSLTSTDAKRVGDSYDSSPEYAPSLVYTYTYSPKTLSINNTNVKSNFEIYPNPFDMTLHINIPEGFTNFDVAIYNVRGKMVYNQHLLSTNENDTAIKIQPGIQASGIYFVKIYSDKGTVLATQRVIKH